MTFELITVFPDFYTSFFKTGMIARAVRSGIIRYRIVGLRKYGQGRLKKVDDTPYGGAEGMLLKKETLENGVKECLGEHVIFMSPRGTVLNHKKAKDLSIRNSLTIVSGHYEGVDQRFIDHFVDEEISVGDYILSGGETASLILMEAISRYLKGFMGNSHSYQNESFEGGCLEHDQYTKPFSHEVPAILKSGDHARIKHWNCVNALVNTYRKRPDLIKKKVLTDLEKKEIKKYFYSSLSRKG